MKNDIICLFLVERNLYNLITDIREIKKYENLLFKKVYLGKFLYKLIFLLKDIVLTLFSLISFSNEFHSPTTFMIYGFICLEYFFMLIAEFKTAFTIATFDKKGDQ